LIQALDDLQRRLDILDVKKDQIMKTACQKALDPLEKSYNTLPLSIDEKKTRTRTTVQACSPHI
jgi:hypothetical protein